MNQAPEPLEKWLVLDAEWQMCVTSLKHLWWQNVRKSSKKEKRKKEKIKNQTNK